LSSGSIWSVLGIAKTTDAVLIRRAYARCLKVTNPEDDPEGFQALRRAYETALRQAKSGGGTIALQPRAVVVEMQTPWPPEASEETGPVADPVAPHPAEANEAPARDGTVDATILLSRADQAAFETVFRRLNKLVASGEATEAELHAALDELLASPALDAVSTQEDAEIRLTGLILGQAPKADTLIGKLVGHFAWDHNKLGRRDPRLDAVLARQKDLVFINDMQRATSPHRAALLALRRRPTRWRVLVNVTTVGLRAKVRIVLERLQTAHQGGLSALNPEALAWWRAFLARPQVPALAPWVGVWLALAAAICLPAFRPGATPLGRLTAFVVTLGAVVGPYVAFIYGVARPRAAWRGQWRWRAPAWLRWGWAPAALGLPFAAAAAAATGSALAAGGLTILAAAVFVWALITGEADEQPRRYPGGFEGMPALIALIVASVRMVFGQGRWAPWPMRAVFSCSYLAVFWLLIEDDVSRTAWRQMSLPLIGAALAMSFGAETLVGLWRSSFKPKAQRRILIGLAVCAALTPILLWAVAPGHRFAPLAAAWTVAVYLAHRPMTSRPSPEALRVLNLVRGIGGPVCLAAASIASDRNRQGDVMLLFAGIWLLAGVAVAVLAALREMRPAPRPA
jgi:hypothetical protein